MRIARSTLIGTAVAMALFGHQRAAQAQAAGAQAAPSGELQEVVVTGIRYSLEQSIEQKRAANTVVDVVTAEDIGKMPDKNIADSLQRVPGLTISSAGANEGGFDEADRVSMRGTNPSLTQTLINGHNVGSGDWFVLDQTGTVGRSVSYTLLPSELVAKIVVNKSSQASLVEGGVAGSIDIITRRPLDDFKEPVTIQASAGAVYADLPGKTSPQFSVLGNWVNDAHNFGVLVQGFSETRDLRRDGQELLGYSTISPTSATALAHPDLANVAYPVLLGSALFQQHRQRNGALLDVEWQVNDAVNLDATGFYSKLDATNLNDNYLMWVQNGFFHDGTGQIPSSYTVTNGTLTSATWAPVAGNNYGVYDQISRPDESASTNFGNLDVHIKATDALSFLGQIGISTAHGRTPTQDVSETLPGQNNGASYTMHGTTTATNWNLGNSINTTPTPGGMPVAFSWIFGDQNMDVLDREVWAKIDGDFKMANGNTFTGFQFGARYTEHQRHLWGVIGQGPGCGGVACPPNLPPDSPNSPFNPANYPTGFQNYPSNYGYGLGNGFPTGIWYWTPQQLAAYDQSYTNRDPVTRADWTSDYGLEEKDAAAFVQANFQGSSWAGNLGLRFVQTKESVLGNVSAAATDPAAITTSAFGPYKTITTDHTYNDILPSANLKLDLTHDLLARFAVAETMTRPDYSALAGSTNLGAPPTPPAVGTGSGSNPDLKPIRSTNVDAGLEWYFAPRSILSATAFYMDLKNYVAFGSETKTFHTFSNQFPNGYDAQYLLSVPVNAAGRVKGIELNYTQAFNQYFGIQTNYTYADGKQTSQVNINGDDRLVGTSKNTFNVIPYFENAHFSARVAYNYRSAFFSGLDRNTAFSQAAVGTFSASLGYTVNDNFAITLDGMNLNNPTLKYYALNTDQPRAFYKNGAQYYLNLRFKL
jgi:iron complex outermembrane receptor protein